MIDSNYTMTDNYQQTTYLGTEFRDTEFYLDNPGMICNCFLPKLKN